MSDNELLDLGDIAALYRCSRRHARDVIVKSVRFPEIAPGSTPRNPLWLRVEVKAFLHSEPKLEAVKREAMVLEYTRFSSEFSEFNEAIRGAKRRASRKGRACDLSPEDAKYLWDRCGGRCEVSGIPFDFSRMDGQIARPFSPSIDRLDNTQGYTRNNVRVVCTAVNVAMNQWGEQVLFAVANAISKRAKQ